jgi:hypothetical protein
MPEWPTNPDWVEPDDGINGGYQYEPADGITFEDFNNIISNLIYLKNHGSAGLQPQLHAPSLSISQHTLTINNPQSNGDFVSEFKVYADTTLIATVSNPIVDLSTYLTTPATYSITAKCCGPNFIDSLASSAVSYVVEAATAPIITDQPDSASYTVGATAVALAVTATGNGTLSYKWQISTDGGSTWNNIGGATSSSYTPDISTESTYMYRCVVTNTLNGTTASTTSNTATIAVASKPKLTAPSISLDGSTLSITDEDGNATEFDIYVDGVKEATVQKA